MSKALLLLAAFIASQEIAESDLVTQAGGEEVFPPAFRGTWSRSVATCRDEYALETFSIGENRLDGYEWDAILLKTTPVIYSSTAGRDTHSVVVLTADRGETDVGVGKRRISLMGGKLYMSNAEAVSDDEHLTPDFSNVRCRGR